MFRQRIITIFILIFSCSLSLDSLAFTIDTINLDILQSQKVKEKQGSIKWEIFAKTQEKNKCTTDKDGYDICLVEPIYSKEIKALHNKEVNLTGFMFPLDPTEKQQRFLIGPYPITCPFDYHSSPSQVVEVALKKPIDFSYNPITIKGKLIVKYNKETGVFYYLKQD